MSGDSTRGQDPQKKSGHHEILHPGRERTTGKGDALYLDGHLEGDPAVLEAAKQVKMVQRTPHHGWQPMTDEDWSDGELAGQALQQAMSQVYGGPLRISVDEDSYDDPPSQVTIAPPGT